MSTNSSNNVVHLDEVIVAMVPFPDFSHLNQLYVVARFIASHNIPVHFICLADRNQDLKHRVQGGLSASNIHFHDLLVPSSLDAGNGLPSIVIFMKKLVEPIRRTCIDISTNAKRLVIIHDYIMMDHIRDAHSLIPNVESYKFHAISTFAIYSGLRQSIDHLVVDDDDDDHEKMIKQMHDEFPLLDRCCGPYAAAS